MENPFPDVAWFSWEYSPISVIPRPRAPAGLSLGLVQTTQTCSTCSVLVLPLSISHSQAVPWENPALSSSFSAGFGGGFSCSSAFCQCKPGEAKLQVLLEVLVAASHSFSGAPSRDPPHPLHFQGWGEVWDASSSSLGMLAPRGRAHGHSTPGAGGIIHLVRENRGREGSLGLF